MGREVDEALRHRLPAAAALILSTAACALGWAGCFGCSFLSVSVPAERTFFVHDHAPHHPGDEVVDATAAGAMSDSEDVGDGGKLYDEAETMAELPSSSSPPSFGVGVFCDGSWSDLGGGADGMRTVAQAFLVVGLILVTATAALLCSLCCFVSPTPRTWKAVSVLSALGAAASVPAFLLFESAPCRTVGNSCSVGTGAAMVLISVILDIAVTVLTSVSAPPRWYDAQGAWRLPVSGGISVPGVLQQWNERKERRYVRHAAAEGAPDVEVGWENGGAGPVVFSTRGPDDASVSDLESGLSGIHDEEALLLKGSDYYAHKQNARLILDLNTRNSNDGNLIVDASVGSIEVSFDDRASDVTPFDEVDLDKLRTETANMSVDSGDAFSSHIGEGGGNSDGAKDSDTESDEGSNEFPPPPPESDVMSSPALAKADSGHFYLEFDPSQDSSDHGIVAVPTETIDMTPLRDHRTAAGGGDLDDNGQMQFYADEKALRSTPSPNGSADRPLTGGGGFVASDRTSPELGVRKRGVWQLRKIVYASINSGGKESEMASDIDDDGDGGNDGPIEAEAVPWAGFVEMNSGSCAKIEDVGEFGGEGVPDVSPLSGVADGGTGPLAHDAEAPQIQLSFELDDEGNPVNTHDVDVMRVVQNSGNENKEDSMHHLAPPSGSEASYGVGSHNSALAPPSGSEADESEAGESDSEDGISDVSESSATGSYLSSSELSSGDDRDDSSSSIADDRESTDDNGGSDMARIIAGVKKKMGTGSIGKGRKKDRKKRHKRRRGTKTPRGGAGLPSSLVSVSSRGSLLDETIDEETDLDVRSELAGLTSDESARRRIQEELDRPLNMDVLSPPVRAISVSVEMGDSGCMDKVLSKYGIPTDIRFEKEPDSGYEEGYLSRSSAQSVSGRPNFRAVITPSPIKGKKAYEMLKDIRIGNNDAFGWEESSSLALISPLPPLALACEASISCYEEVWTYLNFKPPAVDRLKLNRPESLTYTASASKSSTSPSGPNVISPSTPHPLATLHHNISRRPKPMSWKEERKMRSPLHCDADEYFSTGTDSGSATTNSGGKKRGGKTPSIRSSVSSCARSARRKRLAMQGGGGGALSTPRRSRTCDPPVNRDRTILDHSILHYIQ